MNLLKSKVYSPFTSNYFFVEKQRKYDICDLVVARFRSTINFCLFANMFIERLNIGDIS